MSAPRYSVVICTRNRAASLGRTLQALARMTLPGPTEVVVVDNGSTDETPTVVRDVAAAMPFVLRYVVEPRPGKSVALNRGVETATGEFVAFTDDDAIPDPSWLTSLDAGFERYECDWVFGPVKPHWESAEPTWYSRELNGLFALLDLGSQPKQVHDLSESFYGVNCAVRRRSLLALGPYHEALGPTSGLGGGGEDSDMCLRAFMAHQTIWYVPNAVVEHVIAAERATRGFHRRRILKTRQQNYELTAKSGIQKKRVMGIPTFYFAHAIEELGRYLGAVLKRQRGRAFYHELRLLRFGGLFQQGLARAFRRSPAGRRPAVTL
jgi:glycosyltransferase involved in cell wall biosynthesis